MSVIKQGVNQVPGRPGNIKMKCMIWENQPVCARLDQNEVFPLTSETIKTLPDYIKNALSSAPGVQGAWLKEQYIYHNNFILSKGMLWGSSRTDIQAYFDATQLPSNIVPLDDETPHFLWNTDGSLFDTTNVSELDCLNNTAAAQNPSYVKWSIEPLPVPKNDTTGDQTQNTKTGLPTSTPNGAANTDGSGNPITTSQLPPILIFFPSVNNVSQATGWIVGGTGAGTSGAAGTSGTSTAGSGTSGTAAASGTTSGTKPPAGVHWKCTKKTPLFQGEDFFVEIRPTAYASNAQNTTNPLLTSYSFLDSRSNGTGGIIDNAGVVDLDGNYQIIDESRAPLDFNAQPYFIIEMGDNTEHNYFIIIAQNANPRFVHVSETVPVPQSVNNNTGIVFGSPGFPCSRVLSIYDKVSSKDLLKDTLRIQVRQHLGNIIVTFSGHEGDPWVIKRSDPVDTNPKSNVPATGSVSASAAANANTAGEAAGDSSQNDYSARRVAMVIPAAPISLYGGNNKIAWTFAPLQYTDQANVTIPQVIIVKGPAKQSDLNLRLAEQTTYPGVTDPKKKYVYNQDAEEYHETINGQPVTVKQITVQPDIIINQGKAPDKAKSGNKQITNSYIAIKPLGSLQATGGNGGNGGNSGNGAVATSGGTTNAGAAGTGLSNQEQMVQSFYAQYILSSGDYQFPDQNIQGLQPWYLTNCITPVATGWRLYVAAAGCPTMPTPVDVSHHVLSFTDTWSPQDLFKIDHSGSISFLISSEQSGVGGTGANKDYSAYLAALHDKNFFIRVYAWWEDGFMACLPGCNCNGCTGCMDNNIVFTGMCMGGTITTESSTKKVMECQLLDYWKILQDMAFINSPFFDGMRDFNAVMLIMKMAGFRDGTEQPLQSLGGSPVDKWAPLSLLKQFADSQSSSLTVAWPSGCVQSDSITAFEYVLPSSYDILQSPNMKFGDTTKFEDAIVQIAQKSCKVVFFDRWGVFHYENRKEEQVQFQGVNPLSLCEMNFYASPKDFPSELCSNAYQQVVGTYNYRASVPDVFNVIHVFASTPDGGPVFADNINYASIYDPSQPGYIGYRKILYQQNGIYGSLDAVNRSAQYYSNIAFTPPITVSFGSFANGRLRALQLISFSGLQIDNTELNKQPFRLTNVTTTMEPANNMWMAKYEGEYEYFGQAPPS